MDYYAVLHLLEPQNCFPVNKSLPDRALLTYRRLEPTDTALRDDILYLGRSSVFETAIAFPESYYGFIIPDTVSFEQIYHILDVGWAQSSSCMMALVQLSNALWSSKTLQQIVNLASQILENPVAVNNFSFLPLAESTIDHEQTIVAQLRDEFLQASKTQQYIWYNAHREPIDEHIPQIYRQDGQQWMLSAVKIGQITVAWIVVSRALRDFCDQDIQIVQTLSNIVSTYFISENNHKPTDRSYLDVFLRELLSSSHLDSASIDAFYNQFHAFKHDHYCMVAVRWNAGTPDNNVVSSILQQLQIMMPNNPAIFHEKYFAILLGQTQDSHGLLNSNHVLREFLAINNLQAGMSQPFSNLSMARQYFDQAIDTLEALGKLYSNELLIRYGYGRVMQMIHALAKHHDVREFCHPAIKILEEYDEKNASELSRTLQLYLEANGSPSDACQNLFIHRNTLTKRLQKITDLTNIDLRDYRSRLQLSLTYSIEFYLQANGF